MRRVNRKLHRGKLGGSNRQKSRRRVAKVHQKVRRIRNHAIHEATTAIAKQFGKIVIEDLNVKGMVKNRKLARAIHDAGWGEFGRQLAYKSLWYGCELIVADRFYPSSKRCSGCGWINHDLTLKDRTFSCKECDLRIDRDYNAALNLVSVAGKSPETQNACGPDTSPISG